MEKQMEICERFAGKHIVKRNGSVKPFDVTKIVSAVTRAGKATVDGEPAQPGDEAVPEVPVRSEDVAAHRGARAYRMSTGSPSSHAIWCTRVTPARVSSTP